MGLHKRTKNSKKPLLGQILDLIPKDLLQKVTFEHRSDKGCSRYKTYDQLVALTFGQLNKCCTLADISTGLGISTKMISDLGLAQSPAKSTMSDGHKQRSYKVFEDLYYKLLEHHTARLTTQKNTVALSKLKSNSIKVIDASTISLSLGLFDWAKFRTAKGGIKIHTQWDSGLMLPDLVNITEAKVHDIKGLGSTIYPKDTILIEDRGYFDFSIMLDRINGKNWFVTRIKNNTTYEMLEEKELPAKTDEHILKDELIKVTGQKAKEIGLCQHTLRRVAVYDAVNNQTLELLTNNLQWDAATIAELYKHRWKIELFFKSLKQNLKVKTFIGTNENAVKSQIYVALICYMLLELIRRTISKRAHAFSNLCEKIRLCLVSYLSISYVCNHIQPIAQKVPHIIIEKPPDLFSCN